MQQKKVGDGTVVLVSAEADVPHRRTQAVDGCIWEPRGVNGEHYQVLLTNLQTGNCWRTRGGIARSSQDFHDQTGERGGADQVKLTKYILWNGDENWKARGAMLWCGERGQVVPDLQLWADNFWIMRQSKTELAGRQQGVPVDVESTGQFLIMYSLCEKKVGPIEIPIKSDGKCEGGMKKTQKCMVACFKGAHLHRDKAISLKWKCGRMAGRVCHVASNGKPYLQPAPVPVQLFASRSVNDYVT